MAKRTRPTAHGPANASEAGRPTCEGNLLRQAIHKLGKESLPLGPVTVAGGFVDMPTASGDGLRTPRCGHLRNEGVLR